MVLIEAPSCNSIMNFPHGQVGHDDKEKPKHYLSRSCQAARRLNEMYSKVGQPKRKNNFRINGVWCISK